MTNMSYCRFENTDSDVKECYNAIISGEVDISDMSEYERAAIFRIAESCRELAKVVDDITDGGEYQDYLSSPLDPRD